MALESGFEVLHQVAELRHVGVKTPRVLSLTPPVSVAPRKVKAAKPDSARQRSWDCWRGSAEQLFKHKTEQIDIVETPISRGIAAQVKHPARPALFPVALSLTSIVSATKLTVHWSSPNCRSLRPDRPSLGGGAFQLAEIFPRVRPSFRYHDISYSSPSFHQRSVRHLKSISAV